MEIKTKTVRNKTEDQKDLSLGHDRGRWRGVEDLNLSTYKFQSTSTTIKAIYRNKILQPSHFALYQSY